MKDLYYMADVESGDVKPPHYRTVIIKVKGKEAAKKIWDSKNLVKMGVLLPHQNLKTPHEVIHRIFDYWTNVW